MPIVLNIPPSIERTLRGDTDRPLDREALEYAAVEWYRQGRLFHSQFAKLLGVSRYEADEVLKRHEVYDLTPEDFARQLDALRAVHRR